MTEPEAIAGVRVRRLDGLDGWKNLVVRQPCTG